MKVLLENLHFEISDSEFNYMKKNKIIDINKDGCFYIVKDSDFNFLYNVRVSTSKKKKFLDGMIQQNFICQSCGKEHSYGIGPHIDKDGTVDFDKIICYCRQCRLEKLKKRKIVQPVFKQKMDWKKEKELIDKEIEEYNLSFKVKKQYYELCSKIIILERYVDLVLPIRNVDIYNTINKPVNLSNPKERKIVKEKLYKDSKGYCPICGNHMSKSDFTIDHIIAKTLGGEDNLNNLIGMCKHCNLEKGHRNVIQFLSETPLLKMSPQFLKVAYEQQKKARIKLKELQKMKKYYLYRI